MGTNPVSYVKSKVMELKNINLTINISFQIRTIMSPTMCATDTSPTKHRNKRKSNEPKRYSIDHHQSHADKRDFQTSDGEDHQSTPSPRLSSLSPGNFKYSDPTLDRP